MATIKKKSLILLRGLPGAGKSTLAQILSEANKYPVFSVDSYFTNKETGKYKFEYKENHLAYAFCEAATLEAMQELKEKIFIDNTFTLDWEIEPYFKLSKEFDYNIFVLTVENRHGNNNIHEISQEQLQKMANKYEVKLF